MNQIHKLIVSVQKWEFGFRNDICIFPDSFANYATGGQFLTVDQITFILNSGKKKKKIYVEKIDCLHTGSALYESRHS